MRSKSGPQSSAEQHVREIRRQTRKRHSTEDKIRVVLEGLRGEYSIAELCRREGIAQSLYYKWSKEFLEAGKKRLSGDTERQATSGEVKDLRREMSDHALGILQHCLQRLLQEREFDRNSYRAGEVHGSDVPRMIEALLLVSVKNAPDAARFANGKWTDLGQLMPIIDAMMHGAGWSPFVMSTYLTLCERVGATLPIDAFLQHILPHIEGEAPAAKDWIDAALTARIAGVVQTLAEANCPLSRDHALLSILDRLVDLGDRRSAALQLSEYFRGVQLNSDEPGNVLRIDPVHHAWSRRSRWKVKRTPRH